MQKRFSVSVGGKAYTLVTEENEEYLQALAARVDARMIAYRRDLHVSEADAAVLTALELAEALEKAETQAENARIQIQNCLEDASRARAEAADLKREISRLTKK